MWTHKLFSQYRKLALVLTVGAALNACGGTGQDEGLLSSNTQGFSGKVIDGNIARAFVFIDSNNNGTREAWEACSFTDNDGYYSFNPITKTNYCSADATEQQRQYCLISAFNHDNVVIRAEGGYDTLTGEPFLGQMSRRLNVGADGGVNSKPAGEFNNLVISPLTSLMTNLQSETLQSNILRSLSLNIEDLNKDYLNTDGNGTVDPALLNMALKLHKLVTILSDYLTDTYSEIGENTGTPNDASIYVYTNLAEQILNTGESLDNVLSDQALLIKILENAEKKLIELYQQKGYSPPKVKGGNNGPQTLSRIALIASNISTIIDNLIDPTDTTFTQQDAQGSTRALESLIVKTVEEDGKTDTSINNAIDFFLDEQNSSLVDALTSSLSLETSDFYSVVNNDFAGTDFDSVEEITNTSTLPSDATPFGQVGGKMIHILETYLGSAPNNLQDNEAEFYFNGQANDVDGTFTACLKYIEDGSTDGGMKEGSTRGELVAGFWSKINPNESGESFRIVLVVSHLGDSFQASMSSVGTEIINGVKHNKLMFDNGEKITENYSLEGLTDLNFTVPTSNRQCQERLPLRIDMPL
ncbi:MAG: hypothetical protein OEM38_07855 [Gammaproteobacteria bacterium]|nr:hypothetical protein [Gammaproteobacteria bacterium]